MKMFPIPTLLAFLLAVPCGLASAGEPVALPKDVPPVIGTAIVSDDSDEWTVDLAIPKITWEIVGERRPKLEWPEFKVNVQEIVLTLSMAYHPATQLADNAQNRIVDLNGRRLNRAEATGLLEAKTPVLVSVSGAMPDPFYLQCTKPDTLIVILGIPDVPAPQLLPQPQKTSETPATRQEGQIEP
jgi:hypothetical protein